MINGAKYPEFTAKVIVINTQCNFFLSVSLKCCSSYEEFLKQKKNGTFVIILYLILFSSRHCFTKAS